MTAPIKLAHPRVTRGVHWKDPYGFQPFSGRFAFTACQRRVTLGFITDDPAQLTCAACKTWLVQDSIARLQGLEGARERRICPDCGCSDGVDNDLHQCWRCGATWEPPT